MKKLRVVIGTLVLLAIVGFQPQLRTAAPAGLRPKTIWRSNSLPIRTSRRTESSSLMS